MNAVDESVWAPLHRWYSFCRLLMAFHPRVGARTYAAHLFGEPDVKLGWNAMHPTTGSPAPMRYIYIGMQDGKPYGENTLVPPPVPAHEINDVYEDRIAPYAGSVAETNFKALANEIEAYRIPGYGRAEIDATLAAIDKAALEPLRGMTPSVEARLERARLTVKSTIERGGPPSDVLRTIVETISEALRFELSITQASNIVAFIASQLLSLPSPMDDSTLPDRFQAHTEYLTDRLLALKEERQKLALTPFYQATYLALLLSKVILRTCEIAETVVEPKSKHALFFQRRALFVDETAAHELSPSLKHPIDLAPITIDEFLHAGTVGIGELNGIYAGAGVRETGPVDPSVAWPAIQAYAAKAEALDLDATLAPGGANAPLSGAHDNRLTMFLFAMKLGSAAKT